MDAIGAGVTCRHNNSSGTGILGNGTYCRAACLPCGPLQYRGQQQLPRDPEHGQHSAPLLQTASVKFCSSAPTRWSTTSGKASGTGVCQTKNDLTTFTYAQFGKFTRVDLVNDGRTFPYTDPFTGVASSRTFDQEMTNYSNWFAYYRTARVLAAKTTTAIAFNIIDNTYRAGFAR